MTSGAARILSAAFAIVLAICSIPAGADSGAPSHPNIVFILADDQGWTDLRCFGIRSGDFKLIEFFDDTRDQLYNLHNIGEQHDLASQMPEKVKD